MEKKFCGVDIEFKASEESETLGVFEGFGSVFGNIDSYGDIVEKGAFTESIENNGYPALLIQHNSNDIGGIYTDVRETEDGLYVKGELNLDVQKAREAYSLLKQGALKGLSIGFMIKADEYDREKEVRRILKADLMEVSLVTFPANKEAIVTGVKSVPNNERDFEKFLRCYGYDRTTAKAITARGIKGFEDVLREADANKSRDVLREADELKNALSKLKQTLEEF